MPFLIAAVVVGAGVYGAYRALAAAASSADEGDRPTGGPSKTDLGTFERDPTTGVYREPERRDR